MEFDWTRELRIGLRGLLRNPGFVLLAVGTLGLAMGASSGIFSVVDKVLLEPLPFADSERLVYVAGTAPGSDLPEEFPLAREFLVQFQEESKLLDELAMFNSFTSTLRTEERVERVRMSAPTISLFETLGVEPIKGRLPTADDEDVVVISHWLWTTWFGSDPDILGKTYSVSGDDRTVIGVMGPEFWFPVEGTLLWFPQQIRPEEIQPGRFGQPFVARLAPDATPEALAVELETLAKGLPERFGGSASYARLIEQLRPVIRPLEEQLLGDVSGPLWILLGSMGIVLLIACANVANLFMVRAERHQPDQAVRRALGASRGHLIASQLLEASLVAGAAGVLAVGIARAGVPLLLSAAPADVPRLDEVTISSGTLIFTFAVCGVAALLCGLVPALQFSKPSLTRLREGGRGSMRNRRWGRNALVAGQTALALVLLIGSALLLRSFQELRHVDAGYETEDLFTFQIAPEGAHLEDAPSYARFHLGFLERLAALPGVERVGIVENVPLDEGLQTVRFEIEGKSYDDDDGTLLGLTYSAGDYFRAMGIELLAGRSFVPEDHDSQLGHVVISQSAAELLWPGQDPIGKRLRVQPDGEAQGLWETVVGVVEDVRQYGFRRPSEPTVYFPLVGQDPENRRNISSPGYVVKTRRADEIAPEIRALVREVAPEAPMYRTYTMEFLAARSMTSLTFTMMTLGIASALALILGLVGLYGVLSYAVAERTREIGLRMALGAAARQVRLMIVAQGARVLAVGIAMGAILALAATRLLGSLLFGVEAFDPATYLLVAAVMVSVGLAAAYLPARRASAVDPMESLRSE